MNTLENSGGEEGIRTLDTGFGPYNGLANRRLQPLGHLTAKPSVQKNNTRPIRILHALGRLGTPGRRSVVRPAALVKSANLELSRIIEYQPYKRELANQRRRAEGAELRARWRSY